MVLAAGAALASFQTQSGSVESTRSLTLARTGIPFLRQFTQRHWRGIDFNNAKCELLEVLEVVVRKWHGSVPDLNCLNAFYNNGLSEVGDVLI